MRATGICLAVGVDPSPKRIEGARSRLKHMVNRKVPGREEPGIVTFCTETDLTFPPFESGSPIGGGWWCQNRGLGALRSRMFGNVPGMANCGGCEAEFDVSDARKEYAAEYSSEIDYDDHFEGDLCGSCAIAQTDSWANAGNAILMMNGDMDYDADHVEKYL
ncbi:hypothetical protein GA0074695_3056 [Micromonospora viridifaciens]|uniref:Uncharacterized protein n=1 Tax=Micromonospora viridifaciens TaxID=1881 RepID=A0A1C4X6K8_MICVI|nr:hypothetical protein [Micromonospora viridifaciens]SCF04093.1 hypothetical protein GA0074695_3056 [Micromonospora viridifaciens]